MTEQLINLKNKQNLPLPGNGLEALSEQDQELFWRYGTGQAIAPKFDTIHKAIEHFAKQSPMSIAVQHGLDSVNYEELNNLANNLALELSKVGVKQGDHVGLFLRRSISMTIGILACLKLGAAYIPQDIQISPPETQKYIAQQANIAVVLTESKHLEKLTHLTSCHLIAIDKVEQLSNSIPLLPELKAPENITCFILFTSGTTGKPNGVKVSQKNLCNILLTEPGGLYIQPGDKVAHLLNIAFDMAAWEVLGCLSQGGTLIIRGKDFQEAANQANILIATPTILSRIDPSKCSALKRVAVAGEPCPVPLADLWSQYCEFNNSCGPTETTIINTLKKYEPSQPLTIGSPTPNNTVYVLNAEMRPCAIGEVGEMWAGGDCVTQGYLNNPELTEDRYRPDPFLGNGRTMFRTRDLGRWTKTGELEHLGRVDDQVKIKGFRVELDGVSGVIENHSSCDKAVTIKFDNDSLVAFVSPAHADIESIKTLTENTLPYYSVPKAIFSLESIPMTDRGKSDKRKLLTMATKYLEQEPKQ